MTTVHTLLVLVSPDPQLATQDNLLEATNGVDEDVLQASH